MSRADPLLLLLGWRIHYAGALRAFRKKKIPDDLQCGTNVIADSIPYTMPGRHLIWYAAQHLIRDAGILYIDPVIKPLN
jgi:hypothetical protein